MMMMMVEGVKELWLTSEDTGTYGRDIGTSLPQLLWELVKVIPDGCMMRVGMTNPPYILDHLQVICCTIRMNNIISSYCSGYSSHFITPKSLFLSAHTSPVWL